MSARLLLILGGARSGKSAEAERRVAAAGGSILYVATMLAADPAAAARVRAHRRRRPRGWTTVAVGPDGDLAATLAAAGRHDAVLVDGYELVLGLAGPPDDEAAARTARSVAAACRDAARTLACIVSSEVGLGVHPSSAAGSLFRDRAGAANQALAAEADAVVLVVAGLCLALKGPR